jgi:hypothetical protein
MARRWRGEQVIRALGRPLRWLGLVLGALMALLLAAVAAWVVSNWSDAPPQPLPMALALVPARVADDRNMAYALQGFRAAAGREPASVGRVLWKLEQELHAKQRAAFAREGSLRSISEQDLQEHRQFERELLDPAWPNVKGWWAQCEERNGACEPQWTARAEELKLLLEPLAPLGARCEALVGGGLAFEELLLQPSALQHRS